MANEIKKIISEFENIYNGEPWYGKPLMAIINDADPEKVFIKNKPGAHSAYEILHHLYVWRDLLAAKLNGNSSVSIEINSKNDWADLPKEKTVDTWKALIKKLEQNQQNLIKALSKWNDESLDKKFAESNYTLRTFLNGQIQHDIYHTGQIALAIKNA